MSTYSVSARSSSVLPDSPQGPQSLFEEALKGYTNQTGTDLTSHPLYRSVQACTTTESVVRLVQEQARAFGGNRRSDGEISLVGKLQPLVEVVIAVGDALGDASGNVLQPAKLICVGIGLLLRASKGGSDGYDSLVELLDSMSHFLVGRIEVYKLVGSTLSITEIIIKTMAEFLNLITLATKETMQGHRRTSTKRRLGDDVVEDVVKRRRMLPAEIMRVAQGLVGTVSGANKDHDDALGAVVKEMACHMMETKREETRTACRNWLSPPDPSVNHNAKRKLRFTGTTEWFIHGNFFGEWKSNDGSFMWLHGKPGSGKSILCSAIVDYCVQHLRQVGLGIVVYFYCDLQDSAKQTRDSILRSMLVQLSEQSDSYSETLSHFYSELDGRQPCDEELVQCLKSMLERPDEAAKYIIVDALDECPDAGLRSPRKEILRLLEGLAGSHFPNVHVCVTSRPESNIAQALAPLASSSICLQEQPGHARAIIDFLRRSVDTHDEMRNWSSQVKDMVVDALANSAHGMFQFVSCHLDETCGLQPAAIQQNLEGLPKALCESYKLTLRRINEGNWQSAHRIFQRLSLMGRPLSVGELADVLAVDFDEKPPIYRPEWRPEDPEKAVLSTCPGSLLCVVDGASPTERIVQFAHPSVRDFLTSDIISQSPEHISRFRILPAPSDAALLESCLSTLVRIDEAVDEDIKDATDDDGDRDGATDGGVQPATRGQDTGPPRLLLDDSAGPSALGRGISAALRAVVSDIAGLSVLQAVLNGSSATSRSTSRDGQAAALQAASSQGDANAIQFLLSHGTDPNAQGSEGGTALQAAASRGHAEVVQLLLNYGADPNVLGGRHGSALHAAIHRASPPLVIIRLLIFHGADINALDGERATPLQVASYLDRVDVVRLLLECGADVGAQGGRHGGTALQAATDRGHTEVARLLCEFSQDQPAVSDSI